MMRVCVFTIVWMSCGDNAGPRRGGDTAAPKDDAASSAESSVVILQSRAEMSAAVGRRVRVTGTAVREKLGDAVHAPGIRVVCRRPYFPHDRLGTPITVEGVLSAEDMSAETLPSGTITPGTGPGLTYMIADCTLR